MNFNFLTANFYIDFPHLKFPEIERKPDRPHYPCVIIQYQNKICAIPMRSNIIHKYALFSNKEKTKGLDISKMLIIHSKYINPQKVFIDSKERIELLKYKSEYIEQVVEDYISKYIVAHKKIKTGKYRSKHFNLCKNSTLQYFHKELGL